MSSSTTDQPISEECIDAKIKKFLIDNVFPKDLVLECPEHINRKTGRFIKMLENWDEKSKERYSNDRDSLEMYLFDILFNFALELSSPLVNLQSSHFTEEIGEKIYPIIPRLIEILISETP
jgi:hypothetical protein